MSDRWQNDEDYRNRKKIEDSERKEYFKKYASKRREDPEHKEKANRYMKEYWTKNNGSEYNKMLRDRNPEYAKKVLERAKEYREKNKEKCLESCRKHNKKRRATREHKDWRNAYEKNRRDANLEYKILGAIRGRINKSIKRKTESSKDLLGCSMKFFTKHIREMFIGNMSWENYGSVWHLDHIVPCNYFDMTKDYNQKICFNYRNYQPLTVHENCSKQDNLPNNYLEIISEIKLALQMED